MPGAANRILKEFEEQGAHRREIEKVVVVGGSHRALLGLIFAFILGMSAIAAGVWLATKGLEIPGSVIGGGGLIGLVSVFVYGSQQRRTEREQRREALTENKRNH